jgi:RNA polymerase sigma factor (sigma-70 family)
MDCEQLLRSNLGLIERLAKYVCREARVVGADVDDFASCVKLALIENDYAVLRAWEGRSQLSTYLTVVIQRLLADERFRSLGRWRASAEAKRLGESGVLLEMLLQRDERSMAEAIPLVRAVDPSLMTAQIEAMSERLPPRTVRARLVALDTPVAEEIAARDETDAPAREGELRQLSERISQIVTDAIAALPPRDRMLVRLHFGSTMSIADIARVLQVPQRPLYRRLQQILGELRRTLAEAGVDARSAEELVGSVVTALDFGLEQGKNEPAIQTTMRGDL